MVRVVAAGHVNWDVTFELDRLPAPDGEARIRGQRRGGGGSAANVAVGLTEQGVSAGLIGSVGSDGPGTFVRRELEAAGVDTDGLRTVDGETTVKYLLVDDDGEVAVLGNEGVNEAIEPEDVDPAEVTRGEHLHLTSQPPDTAAELAEVAAEAGMTVSVDPGRRSGDRDLSAAVDRADVVFATEREADPIRDPGTTGADHALVVKRGNDGAVLRQPGERHEHPGFEVDATDTSGAGDAFVAGFLSVWLDERDPDRALAVGNACGALAATELGARSVPDRETVRRFLEERSPPE